MDAEWDVDAALAAAGVVGARLDAQPPSAPWYLQGVWLALSLLAVSRAYAIDVDVTIEPPKGDKLDFTLHDLEPGPVPGGVLVPWFDGKQAKLSMELYHKKGQYILAVELAELRVLEDGTIQVVLAKEDRLTLAADKRTKLTLSAPGDGEGGVEAWSMEANTAPGVPKVAAPKKAAPAPDDDE